jgi:hypothetical protein
MKKKLIKAGVIALGATPLLFVMPLSAGANGAPVASVGVAAGTQTFSPATTLPSTKIVGTTAHFKPTALTATAVWNGSSECTSAMASFLIKNKESRSEKVKLRGTDGLGKGKVTIPASSAEYVCVTSGYTGVMTLKLSDANVATVTF